MRHETATALLDTGVRLHYRYAGEGDRVIVLLHGWPQDSWQWRHVIPLLADAGYRVIAPDVRGAGRSSRPRLDEGFPSDPRSDALPRGGYSKREVAADVHELLVDHLELGAPAFVVGHDIGAMVAVAYALAYRDGVRAVSFGEAPLPGTEAFDENRSDLFHFAFHNTIDLPETLVTGHERAYLEHFYDKLGYAPEKVDADHYVEVFEQAGALRAGFDLYRAFDRDAADTRAALADGGRISAPCLGVAGETSPLGEFLSSMGEEVAETFAVKTVPRSCHWLAEENPDAVSQDLIDFDPVG